MFPRVLKKPDPDMIKESVLRQFFVQQKTPYAEAYGVYVMEPIVGLEPTTC